MLKPYKYENRCSWAVSVNTVSPLKLQRSMQKWFNINTAVTDVRRCCGVLCVSNTKTKDIYTIQYKGKSMCVVPIQIHIFVAWFKIWHTNIHFGTLWRFLYSLQPLKWPIMHKVTFHHCCVQTCSDWMSTIC